jgi:hypothetical protein
MRKSPIGRTVIPMREQRYDVLGFGLVLLAVALLALAGTADTLFAENSWWVRWQGLIGALLGAAGTIFAGWLAYHGVQKQLAAAETRAAYSQQSAKEAAVLAMTQPVHSAARLFASAKIHAKHNLMIQRMSAREDLARNVYYLERSLQHFSLREIAADLSAEDRSAFLALLLRLESVVMIVKPLLEPSGQSFALTPEGESVRMLGRIHQYILRFDQVLAEVFERDAMVTYVFVPEDDGGEPIV